MERQIILVVLVALAAAGVMYALVYPYLSGEIKGQKRTAAMLTGGNERGAAAKGADPAKRRKLIAESLKEIETQKKRKVTLEQRIVQAGLTW